MGRDLRVATRFSTVIVTRNRPDALALSLPLHLTQSALPERILVIDSSDDPSANQALVGRLARDTAVPLAHQTAPAGISLQRNIGLDQVSSDVVFMPDDDSLLHEGAVEAMLRVYDADSAGQVGGVCAVESRTPPPGTIEPAAAARPYSKSRMDRLKLALAPRINRFEDRHAPDPMKVAARRLYADLPAPAWMGAQRAVRVEWMTGFRMSFRTALLKQVRFNELLGRYSLYEDVDAGLRAIARGYSLLAAEDAAIYHHRSPENRSNGRVMGAILILNRAYVACRSGLCDSRMQADIRRHARLVTARMSLLAVRNAYERERLAGARKAIAQLPGLFAAGSETRDQAYLSARQACLED